METDEKSGLVGRLLQCIEDFAWANKCVDIVAAKDVMEEDLFEDN